MRNLPNEQVIALEKAFRKAKRGREKIRYQALWLLSRGYKRAEVIKLLGISKQTLGGWVTRYKKDGLKGLLDKAQPGNHHKLTKKQKTSIKALINTQTPLQLGFKGQFWNIETLEGLIKEKFNVRFHSRESYRSLLHWCGFSFHKGAKVNIKQSEYTKVRFEETLKKDSKTGLIRKIRWSW